MTAVLGSVVGLLMREPVVNLSPNPSRFVIDPFKEPSNKGTLKALKRPQIALISNLVHRDWPSVVQSTSATSEGSRSFFRA